MARALIALFVVSLLFAGLWWYRSSSSVSPVSPTEMQNEQDQTAKSISSATVNPPAVSNTAVNSNSKNLPEKADKSVSNDAAPANDMEAAMQSMQQSLKGGDNRTPELAPQYEREKPSAEALADPERYAEYEAGQSRNVASVYLSILSQIPTLRARIDAARSSGSKTAEQLAEAEEALAKLEELQKEMETTHPEVLNPKGDATNAQAPADDATDNSGAPSNP